MSNGGELQVPDGWEKYTLKQLANKSDRHSFTGGPFGSNLKVDDYTENGIRIIQLQNIGDGKFLNNYKIFTSTEKADELLSCNIFPNDIILSKMGDPVARATIIPTISSRYLMASDGIRLALDHNKFDNHFVLNAINFHKFRDQAEKNSTGTTRKRIGLSELREVFLVAPPLPEQKRIASILTSVDDVIEKTEAQISKLQDLKKGMMTELLTKGIGHTEFKDSPVGRIPKSWRIVPYSDVVQANMSFISLNDNGDYSPVIVRRRHNGIEIREVKKGKTILVKQQYKAIPGTFLISKRQIYHGSCGIVPNDLGDNAIISKEYLALSTKPVLDVRFLDYFSHSNYFQGSIIRTTYGIDEEKFVFKEKWWLRELMPLPSLEEQQQICDSIDSIGQCLNKKFSKLSQSKALKKALMNDLLTGRKRVGID